jgi:hypothetical protein
MRREKDGTTIIDLAAEYSQICDAIRTIVPLLAQLAAQSRREEASLRASDKHDEADKKWLQAMECEQASYALSDRLKTIISAMDDFFDGRTLHLESRDPFVQFVLSLQKRESGA